jgi:hypothetical protein
MAKEEKMTDILERDVVKLWYTDFSGKTYMVYQYVNSAIDPLRGADPEKIPIYVNMEGYEGMELGHLLDDYNMMKKRYNSLLTEEHDKLKREMIDTKESFDIQASRMDKQLEEMNEVLSDILTREPKKHWWNRSKD